MITIKSTDEVPDFIDITDRIKTEINNAGLKNGSVLVYSRHTTASIIIQEPEENLKKDLQKLLSILAPKDNNYYHSFAPDHIEDKLPNGHSHCQHLFMGTSEIIPFVDGKIMLGQYQSIFLVELDRARSRDIVIQINGE